MPVPLAELIIGTMFGPSAPADRPMIRDDLVVPGTDSAIHLLTEVFGCTLTAVHRNDEGMIEHAEAKWPGGGGVMFSARGNLWSFGTYRGACSPVPPPRRPAHFS